MVATETITKFFQTSSTRQFSLLAENNIKRYENSICTSSLKKYIFLLLFSLLNLSVKTALPHKIPWLVF